jgi:hypothetical protein
MKALKYLQMNETDKLYDEMMLDVRHVQRENVFMSQGQKLTKIDTKGTPPPQMNPVTGQMMPGMGPAMKQEVQRDPMTGQPSIDPATGQPQMYEVTINPFDNHQVHIQEHEAYQKTQEYEMLDPQIQQIIQDHVDEHKQEMMKERNALQTDQAMSDMAKTNASDNLSPDTGSGDIPPDSNSAAPDMGSGAPETNGASPVGALSGPS